MKTTLEQVTTNGKLDPEKMLPLILAKEERIELILKGMGEMYFWYLTLTAKQRDVLGSMTEGGALLHYIHNLGTMGISGEGAQAFQDMKNKIGDHKDIREKKEQKEKQDGTTRHAT